MYRPARESGCRTVTYALCGSRSQVTAATAVGPVALADRLARAARVLRATSERLTSPVSANCPRPAPNSTSADSASTCSTS
ncbi:hypothetical protein [Streptomyces avermitilis]|uniref:hypothetical protein n=1 Tax=Streptomyces avermitilis TaxID=33903 RepID=UPI0038171959